MNQISLKDTFLNILNNSIIIGFWTGVFWLASNLFLGVIGLQYRAWVTNSLIAICFFLMTIWVIYKIITQKDRWKRMKMLLALFGLLIVLWLARFPLLVIGTAVLHKERVDTIDGQTFVGYETDFIDCELWNAVANNTAEYCKKGDVIGVKGRLQTQLYNKEDGSTVKTTKVVAEKITFLSSKKENED